VVTSSTAYWTGTTTSYQTVSTPTGSQGGYVVEYDPSATGTRTVTYSGSASYTGATTSYATQSASGPNSATLTVYQPSATGYTTITYSGTAYTGTTTSSSTLAQPAGTTTGTVQMYYPSATGYQTVTYTGTTSYAGTTTSTQTLAQPSGTNSGTVQVYYPSATGYQTVTYTGTSSYAGTTTLYSTQAKPSGTASGTVVVYQVSAGYNTVTSTYGPSATTSTVPASGTSSGTVYGMLCTSLSRVNTNHFQSSFHKRQQRKPHMSQRTQPDTPRQFQLRAQLQVPSFKLLHQQDTSRRPILKVEHLQVIQQRLLQLLDLPQVRSPSSFQQLVTLPLHTLPGQRQRIPPWSKVLRERTVVLLLLFTRLALMFRQLLLMVVLSLQALPRSLLRGQLSVQSYSLFLQDTLQRRSPLVLLLRRVLQQSLL
jgi:hypothetical protein